MEFCKKVEEFGMFGLTFQIKKDKKSKCRSIFCDGVLITGVENYMEYYKISRLWDKYIIMNKFSEECKRLKLGRNQILDYIKQSKQ